MIDDVTRAGFADELEKIAYSFKQFGRALHAGWEGLDRQGHPIEGAGWMLGNKGWRSRVPMGGKALTLLGTMPMVPAALAKDDPQGLQRSRTERVLGLAGNTLGGLAGTGALMTTGFGGRHPLLAGLAGGTIGGVTGEKLLTAPFAIARHFGRRNPAAPPRVGPAIPGARPADDGWRNVAPGGRTTTPDITVGQAQAI